MDLNPLALWQQMTILVKGVVVILLVLSIWSLYVCIERWLIFRKAKKQSLDFIKLAADHIKHDRPQAVLDAANKYPQSHLARAVPAALQSFLFERQSSPLPHIQILRPAVRAAHHAHQRHP